MRPNTPKPGDADSSEPLSDSQIEAILAEEGAQPPEAGAPAPEHRLHQNEPGTGRFGGWMVWALIAFVAMGVVQTLR
jgi:hypothetical protein